jgi:hypothetical protein
MASDKNVPRFGVCSNVANCGNAAADDPVEWYIGAGEYCPECGEALTLREPASSKQPAAAASAAKATSALATASVETNLELPTLSAVSRRRALRTSPQGWLVIAVGALVAAGVYAWHRDISGERAPDSAIAAISRMHQTPLRAPMSGSTRDPSMRGELAGASTARPAVVTAVPAASAPQLGTSACLRESSGIKGEDLYRECVRTRVKLHVLMMNSTSKPDIERYELQDGLAEIRQAVGAAQIKMTSTNSFIRESVATFEDLKKTAADNRVRGIAQQCYDRYVRLAAHSEGGTVSSKTFEELRTGALERDADARANRTGNGGAGP